jgi:hypothetical protein
VRAWFTTATFARSKKKHEHYLTWFWDQTSTSPAFVEVEGVIASDMPWMMDQLELGIRVARLMRQENA